MVGAGGRGAVGMDHRHLRGVTAGGISRLYGLGAGPISADLHSAIGIARDGALVVVVPSGWTAVTVVMFPVTVVW